MSSNSSCGSRARTSPQRKPMLSSRPLSATIFEARSIAEDSSSIPRPRAPRNLLEIWISRSPLPEPRSTAFVGSWPKLSITFQKTGSKNRSLISRQAKLIAAESRW